MKRALQVGLKIALLLACLVPVGVLAWEVFFGFTVDPIQKITDRTGIWTLRFILITLAVTPIRRLSGWNDIVKSRRMLGNFAFFYGSLHFLTWILLDHMLDWQMAVEDITKRPFITVGMLGFLAMVPLAVTSTRGWVIRLGRKWKALHRLVYLTAVAGAVHFYWRVKADHTEPLVYGAILALLLGYRLMRYLVENRRSLVPS